MKLTKCIYLILATLLCAACNFSVNTDKNFSKGIAVNGNGLSAANIFLSDGVDGLENRTFAYGKKVHMNFVDLEGFAIEDEHFYPQMDMVVTSKKGDTVMHEKDLFGEFHEGLDINDPSVNGQLTIARPIYSGNQYTLHFNIWDTRGEGALSAKMDFKVEKDRAIEVVKNGLDYSEVYLMSDDRKKVITDGEFDFYENMRFDFQDLNGYVKNGDKIELGMNVKVVDTNGDVILNNQDIFKDRILDEELLKSGISSTLKINKGQVSNPLKWQVEIWDKNSDAKLKAETKIVIKD